MTPYFEQRNTLNPFEWSWVRGEGETAGLRIDGSGRGIYNLIRPALPIAANDGITFTVQCRIKSRLNLNGDRQGFNVQVRGFNQNGTSIRQVFTNNVVNDQESWYTRQDPDFVLHTVKVSIPSGTGMTHMTVEPIVHAGSGHCDITSCRVRVTYESLIEYVRESESNGNNPGELNYTRFLLTESVYIPPGTEVMLDWAGDMKQDYGAHVTAVSVKFRKRFGGDYETINIVQSTSVRSTYFPVVGNRIFVSDDEYDQLEIIAFTYFIGAPQSDPVGVLSIKDARCLIMTRDVLREGA